MFHNCWVNHKLSNPPQWTVLKRRFIAAWCNQWAPSKRKGEEIWPWRRLHRYQLILIFVVWLTKKSVSYAVTLCKIFQSLSLFFTPLDVFCSGLGHNIRLLFGEVLLFITDSLIFNHNMRHCFHRLIPQPLLQCSHCLPALGQNLRAIMFSSMCSLHVSQCVLCRVT